MEAIKVNNAGKTDSRLLRWEKIKGSSVKFDKWEGNKQQVLLFRGEPTHPRHKCEDVVLLVLDDVFGELLLTFLRAAEPHRPRLQLLLPSTHVGQAVAAAEGGRGGKEIHTFALNQPTEVSLTSH